MYRPYVRHFLKGHVPIFLILLAAGFISSSAHANNAWPVIEGKTDLYECKEALFIANRFFYDDYRPDSDDLNLEHEFFEHIQESVDYGYGKEAIFWEISPKAATRLVVTKNNMGWRGSVYSLFSIDKQIDIDSFKKADAKKQMTPLIEDRWNQFPVFDKSLKGVWAIDLGPSYIALPDWDIYGFNKGNFSKLCTVKFTAEIAANADVTSLLPEDVEIFAQQLSDTLGDDEEEGTLQAVARLKNRANKVWANVAVRPWLVPTPTIYHIQSVDNGLLKWSTQKDKFKKHYNELVEQKPKAQAALEAYYIKHFDKSKREAKEMAEHNLNAAYVSYYAFAE